MTRYQLYHFRGKPPSKGATTGQPGKNPPKDPASSFVRPGFLGVAVAQISALEKEVFPELFCRNAPDHRARHERELRFRSNCVFFAARAEEDGTGVRTGTEPFDSTKGLEVVSFVFTTSQAGTVRLTSLGTHPDHRKKGLASRLMANALSYHATHLGCSSASLLVRAGALGARRLYAGIRLPAGGEPSSWHGGGPEEEAAPRLRFEEAGDVLPQYYADGEDAVCMELRSLRGCPRWDPRQSRSVRC